MRGQPRSERGVSLVETALAMALMAVVMTSVGTAVKLISEQSTVMTTKTVDIDQLQTAEQTIVRDIHAADNVPPATAPWCYGSGTSPSATPSSELEFTANINGTTEAFDIKLSGGQLTVASSTTCAGLASAPVATLASNLTSSSGFTVAGCANLGSCAPLPTTAPASWTGGSGASYSFYPALGVSLTMSGPNGVSTTVADHIVDIWNVEDQCQAAWQVDPQTSPPMTDPC